MQSSRNTAARSSLSEAVYERVKADIFDFRLLPGTRFSENEIAERAQVSRTPVREALQRLEREGFLSVHAKSGWSVRLLDFERFEHLYDVRVIVETAAVKKLCSGEPGPALLELKRVWSVPPRQRIDDWSVVSGLDEAFHATLVAATGNPELSRIHADIQERIRIVRRLDFTSGARVHCTYDEHAAIVKAILSRKAQQANMLLRSHIETSKLEVRKISLHRLHLAHLAGRPA
ncbi:MAG: GntR family transcriptional regulator [Betaproteobacteria bacterium]|nr:GntR family transcriptional regulator [Betaproteobacteria bacterium]